MFDESHTARTHSKNWLSPKALPLPEWAQWGVGAPVVSCLLGLGGGGGEACFIAKVYTSRLLSRAKNGDLAVQFLKELPVGGSGEQRLGPGPSFVTPPEEPAPGRASAPPHLRLQGRQQNRLQAQAGDRKATRPIAASILHLGTIIFTVLINTSRRAILA